MVYITTTKNLEAVPSNALAEDTLLVFYHAADTLKACDVDGLLQKEISVKFVLVADRDDMMFSLGQMISGEDAVTYLDGSIPVPKRFADKITVVKQAKQGKDTSRRSAKKPVAAETEVKAEAVPEAPSVKTAFPEDALPLPVVDTTETEDLQKDEAKPKPKAAKPLAKPQDAVEDVLRKPDDNRYSGARAAFEKAKAKIVAEEKAKAGGRTRNSRDLSAFRSKKGE